MKLNKIFSHVAIRLCIKILILFCLTNGLSANEDERVFSARALKQSVIKIYVSSQQPDYLMPWQKAGRPVSGNGTGFVIAGRRILTNAHVVSDANFIEVRKEGYPGKYEAKIEFIGHDCDLAILTVDDDAFFVGTEPLVMREALPELNDVIVVVGYPIGGERISVTRGVVSRIDYSLYVHSGVDSHLVIQVDAAINPGNSGGPAMLDGKVVGLAFQGLHSAQSIGYAIALPVINRFLADIEDGFYDGYPELGVSWQETRNPALRADLAIDDKEGGIVIGFVDPFASGAGLLRPRDVLLMIDNYPIAYDGTIMLDGNVTEFVELLERKQCGESVVLSVWRDAAAHEIIIPLRAMDDPFVFRREYGRKPEYFIVGGLVFSPLTRGYLEAIGLHNNARHFRYYMSYAKVDGFYKDRDQFVVLTMRLPHPCNTYAEPFINAIVSNVNGRRIRHISDIETALEFPDRGFHVFQFEGMDEKLIIDAIKTAESEAIISMKYGIARMGYFEKNESKSQIKLMTNAR